MAHARSVGVGPSTSPSAVNRQIQVPRSQTTAHQDVANRRVALPSVLPVSHARAGRTNLLDKLRIGVYNRGTMIPNIAVILSSYIGFRMIEIFLFPTSRYSSTGTAIAARVFAVIALLVTIFCCLDILFTGSTPTLPR